MSLRRRHRPLRRHREPLAPNLAKVGQAPGELHYTGPVRDAEVRATLLSFGSDGVEELREVPIEDAMQAMAEPGGRMHWLDLSGVHDLAVLRAIGQTMHLDPLCLEEIAQVGGRPRVVHGEGYLRLRLQVHRVSPAAFDAPAALHQDQLTLLLQGEVLVTVQEQPGPVIEGLRARLRQDSGLSRHLGAGHLAATVLDLVVEQGLVAVAALSESLEELEEGGPEAAGPAALSQVMDVERELVLLERAALPMVDVANALRHADPPPLGQKAQSLLLAVADQAFEVLELAGGLRRMTESLQRGYASALAHRQMQSSRATAVTAAVFLPLLSVAAVAGLLWGLLPPADWRWAAGGLAVALGLAAWGGRSWLRRRGLV